MKKLVFLFLVVSTFVSCSHDFPTYDPAAMQDKDASDVTIDDIKANVAKIFGSIDPNHDWNLISKGSVTIKADANLDNITKVQILSESPYLNSDAQVINEASVSKGGQVTLTYEAPSTYTRLIAACVSSNGQYFIKGFNVGDAIVSFNNTHLNTRGATRADSDFPVLTNLKLEYLNSIQSYNAIRTIYANEAATDPNKAAIVEQYNLGFWKDSNWENERLWKLTEGNSGSNTWSIVDRTLQHEVSQISTDEAEALKDIFGTYLKRERGRDKRMTDNMELIRNSNFFTMYNNHLTANGDPVIVTPVQMPSTDIDKCWLYYYYYDPADLQASGLTEQNYIKMLPKFKAIQCDVVKKASGVSDKNDFFRKYEYLLPYYGAPQDMIDKSKSIDVLCTTDGNLYRIRNIQQLKGEDYYMTYLGKDGTNDNKLATKYGDEENNVANQLWQIFNTPDGRVLLYNVGGKKFLTSSGEYATVMSTKMEDIKKNAYLLESFDEGYWRIWRNSSKNLCIGTDLTVKNSLRISTDKAVSDGDRSKWVLEAYEGSQSLEQLETVIWESKPFEVKAKSAIIPKGHRVGFMLRKGGHDENFRTVDRGCIYGVSGLNREINQFPNHFSSALDYSMEIDDPRIAMFKANDKIYMTFEDGTDCSFGDMIIEVTSGGEQVSDEYSVQNITYTMCFEDRPLADYDMNDVVLKFVRTDATHVKVSLVACGANDELYLRGLKGSKLNETTEIHAIFGKSTQSFVNTVSGQEKLPVIEESFEIGADKSLTSFIESIFIYDKTQNRDITLAREGEDPHAIVIPSDFDYPQERVCIKNAYPLFTNWARNADNDKSWFRNVEESLVFKK